MLGSAKKPDPATFVLNEMSGDLVKCSSQETTTQNEYVDDEQPSTPLQDPSVRGISPTPDEGASVHAYGTPLRKSSDYKISQQTAAKTGQTRSESVKKKRKKTEHMFHEIYMCDFVAS